MKALKTFISIEETCEKDSKTAPMFSEREQKLLSHIFSFLTHSLCEFLSVRFADILSHSLAVLSLQCTKHVYASSYI